MGTGISEGQVAELTGAPALPLLKASSTGKYVARKEDPRYATLTILRQGKAPVLKNDGAEAWDLGDGVLAQDCFLRVVP